MSHRVNIKFKGIPLDITMGVIKKCRNVLTVFFCAHENILETDGSQEIMV